MNTRTKERVMLAASRVTVANNREAAVLGGIVTTTIREGHFEPSRVMAWADQALSLKSSERTTMGEVAEMTMKFKHEYLGGV